MNLIFDVKKIQQTPMDSVIPYLFKKSPRDHREEIRLFERHERQYQMLVWLSWQFHKVEFLDIGTRTGTSAICLANNPANEVTTCDINTHFKGVDVRPFLANVGIDFLHLPAMEVPNDLIENRSIISLDISHNGADEAEFLAKLDKMGYNGIVIMDDINCPRKFKELHNVWNAIERPKLLLPREISHDTGTGVVIYGQHEVSVILPTDESEG